MWSSCDVTCARNVYRPDNLTSLLGAAVRTSHLAVRKHGELHSSAFLELDPSSSGLEHSFLILCPHVPPACQVNLVPLGPKMGLLKPLSTLPDHVTGSHLVRKLTTHGEKIIFQMLWVGGISIEKPGTVPAVYSFASEEWGNICCHTLHPLHLHLLTYGQPVYVFGEEANIMSSSCNKPECSDFCCLKAWSRDPRTPCGNISWELVRNGKPQALPYDPTESESALLTISQ